MQPIDQITTAFQRGKPAFMPYFSLGFPDLETSLQIIQTCVANGADLIELGLPFSDPLADGPTIQHSTQVALQNGMTTRKCLDALQELRARGVGVPLLLMGYYNPILAYGLARFVEDARLCGANGLIVPDLPPEEADELVGLCEKHGLGFICFLAPTSTAERIALVAQKARGFVYLVSVTGITGARNRISDSLPEFIARVRAQVSIPLAVGFGISTPEQARQVGQLADGVIIGSQLIKLAENSADPLASIGAFVREVKASLS